MDPTKTKVILENCVQDCENCSLNRCNYKGYCNVCNLKPKCKSNGNKEGLGCALFFNDPDFEDIAKELREIKCLRCKKSKYTINMDPFDADGHKHFIIVCEDPEVIEESGPYSTSGPFIGQVFKCPNFEEDINK
jgi:hypothetical protein